MSWEAILGCIGNSRAIDFTVGVNFFFFSVPIHALGSKSFFLFFKLFLFTCLLFLRRVLL